jgi:hypothetical protein
MDVAQNQRPRLGRLTEGVKLNGHLFNCSNAGGFRAPGAISRSGIAS